MVRKAKKDEEEEKDEDIETADEDTEEEEGEEESASSDVKSVTFTIRNQNHAGGHSTRVFDKASQGPDFLEAANEFEASNTHKKPANMQDAKEVEACVEFNKNINHPILSRKDE